MGTKQHHVAVIGAGFAGLAAAKTLLESGRGCVAVKLLEAAAVVGGRARRGQLETGPVELGATWFHGTVGNPVYEYATTRKGASTHDTLPQQQQQQPPLQDKPKDNTANANGSDPRWELQLVAPGHSQPLSGPQHQVVLSAFEQYSLAVENVAEDAAAAAAVATSAALAAANTSSSSRSDGGSNGTRSDTASAAAAAAGSGSLNGPAGPSAESAVVAGCSLGQVLRARYDRIMTAAAAGAPAGNTCASKSACQQEQHQQHEQPQQQHQHQQQEHSPHDTAGSSQAQTVEEAAALLAADETGVLLRSFAEGWGCRERLQRAYDGFHSSDCAGLAHMTEYQDLDGPNIPVPGGYQSIAEALAAESQALGLQLHLNCPVARVDWARADGKVALLLQPTPDAIKAFGSSSGGGSSGGGSSGGDSSGGIEVLFDACIMTCSLGVLKASAEQLFVPQLPSSKLDAIEKLHIGQVEKLFVEWPSSTAEAGATHQQQQGSMQGSPASRAADTPAGSRAAAATLVSAPAAAAPAATPAAASAAAAASSAPQLLSTPVVGPRKPKPRQLHDVAPPEQAASAAAAAAAVSGGAAAATGSAGSAATRAAAAAAEAADSVEEDTYTTYCLMWPAPQGVWGSSWLQQQQQQQWKMLPMDIPAADAVYVQSPTSPRSAAAAAAAAPGQAAAAAVGGGVGVLSDRNNSSSNNPTQAAASEERQLQQRQQQVQQGLPEWLQGLHSWRYGDGPEWIKPADSNTNSFAGTTTTSSSSSSGGGGASSADVGVRQQQQQQQRRRPPAFRSAVVWVTGRAAQQMGQLSDQQVLQDLDLLLQTFPAIPRQPRQDTPAAADSGSGSSVGSSSSGAHVGLAKCKLLRSTWTSSPFFRGSYSYPSPQADGSTADALAAPLTVADATAAAAAVGAAAVGVGVAAQEDSSDPAAGSSSSTTTSSSRVLVCFAGEATSRQHMGTVHGAFSSGVREAHRLLGSWGVGAGSAAATAAEGTNAPAEYHAAFWL